MRSSLNSDQIADARKLVDIFMGAGRKHFMDPAYLHRCGAGNTARALEKALAVLAAVPPCPDCGGEDVVETTVEFDRKLNCELCGHTFSPEDGDA